MTHQIILLIFLIACSQAITSPNHRRSLLGEKITAEIRQLLKKNEKVVQSGPILLKNHIEEVLEELLSSWRSPIEEESLAGTTFTHLPQNHCEGHPGGIKQEGYTLESCRAECAGNSNCSGFDVTNANWKKEFMCVIVLGEYTTTCTQSAHNNWDHYKKAPKALPECIQVFGSPTHQIWCDGIYTPTSDVSSEGTRVYVKHDFDDNKRYLYWNPRHGGQWQIDTNNDANKWAAFFPETSQKLPVFSGEYWEGWKWTEVRGSKIKNSDCNAPSIALPECIQVVGSPTQQIWCDGIYTTTSDVSSEGTRVYVNHDAGEVKIYLYWSPLHGGQWLIDTDVDAKNVVAFFPETSQKLPVSSGEYWDGRKWTEVQGSKIKTSDCNHEKPPPDSDRRRRRSRLATAAEDNVALPSSWRNRIEEESLAGQHGCGAGDCSGCDEVSIGFDEWVDIKAHPNWDCRWENSRSTCQAFNIPSYYWEPSAVCRKKWEAGMSMLCLCEAGSDTSETCVEWGDESWCYLAGGLSAVNCPGATKSSFYEKYWSKIPCDDEAEE